MLHPSEVSSPPEEFRSEAAFVVASSTFTRSQRLGRLLAYLCGKYLSGEADQIKEYNIAVDLLGRPVSFDPAEDAIARVEVHRLRKKLREFYETEGAGRKLRIVIPTGCYVPSFVRVGQAAADPAPPPVEAPAPETTLSELAAQAIPDPPGVDVRAAPPSRPVFWRRHFVPVLLGVGAVAGVCAILIHHPVVADSANIDRPPAQESAGPLLAPGGAELRFLAGRSEAYSDSAGRTWGADKWYSGGSTYSAAGRLIARTSDPALFNGGRQGVFGYDIPLRSGVYELRLYFAETSLGPGNPSGGGENSRVFHVLANGRRILSEFDVISDAQGPNVADIRVFKDISPGEDGLLHMRFLGSMGPGPILSAVEISPARPHRLNPLRMTVQPRMHKSPDGRVWMPDNFWSGGQPAQHGSPVQHTPDAMIYDMERYGNFSYAIPVAEGTYKATVYLAETYWGQENPGGGGPGTRVFDIFCNGVALARNVDVYSRVGGNRGLRLEFSDLKPNAQGKLLLSFVPVKNYATLCALEVEDVSR